MSCVCPPESFCTCMDFTFWIFMIIGVIGIGVVVYWAINLRNSVVENTEAAKSIAIKSEEKPKWQN